MAKEVIALNSVTTGTTINYQCVFWYPVSKGTTPSVQNSAWTGASAAENSAIVAGSVLEEQGSYPFPLGLDVSHVKAYLQQVWINRNGQLGGNGPASVYGVFFDSVAGWSA